MIIRRITDIELIKKFWSDVDYSNTSQKQWDAILETMVFLLVSTVDDKDEFEHIGLFVFRPLSPIIFEGHMVVDPKYRGEDAVSAGKAIIAWLRSQSKCELVIGFTPATNISALKYIKKLGFKTLETLPRSIYEDGVLIDQVISTLRVRE